LHEDVRQHVAQLLPDLGGVTAFDRIDEFLRLLDEVGGESLGRLCLIPRAAVRAEQALHDAADAVDTTQVLLREQGGE
jgi:hypothetical protein